MEVQEKEKETLLCLPSTMWHLVWYHSGAKGLQRSAWIHSWKKVQQSWCCTSTEDLARGNLKQQAAVESGDEQGLPVLSLRSLSERWQWPGEGVVSLGKAPLQCLILLNSILLFLCLPVSSYSLFSQKLLLQKKPNQNKKVRFLWKHTLSFFFFM